LPEGKEKCDEVEGSCNWVQGHGVGTPFHLVGITGVETGHSLKWLRGRVTDGGWGAFDISAICGLAVAEGAEVDAERRCPLIDVDPEDGNVVDDGRGNISDDEKHRGNKQ